MATIDIFRSNAFGLINMTKSIQKVPYIPSLLDRLGIFQRESINTTTATIEEENGKLSLIQTSSRDSLGQSVMSGPKRKLRAFQVPFIPSTENVMAADIQNLRAFGSENDFDTVANQVNKKLTQIKNNIEVTKEWHRMGAINGILLDADGSTILNYFNEFQVSPSTADIDFTSPTVDAKLYCTSIWRAMDAALGGTPYNNVICIAGNEWFDSWLTLPDVEKAFVLQSYTSQVGPDFFMKQQANVSGGNQYPPVRSFRFGDIDFYNYRGTVGSQKFVADNKAIFIPGGAPDVFVEFNSPAPFMETANTLGQPFYAKQEPLRWGIGVELLGCSCPLMLCTRPASIITSTGSDLAD